LTSEYSELLTSLAECLQKTKYIHTRGLRVEKWGKKFDKLAYSILIILPERLRTVKQKYDKKIKILLSFLSSQTSSTQLYTQRNDNVRSPRNSRTVRPFPLLCKESTSIRHFPV
jgi:hypothetical protein